MADATKKMENVQVGEDVNTENTESSASKKKKNKKKKKLQSIDKSFPDGVYPEGQWMEYPLEINSYRTTDEEKRYLDRQQNNRWQEFRKGAEIHRRVRERARRLIKPGMKMLEVADIVEDAIRAYTGNEPPLKQGIGFPTGMSLNHVAAHYTPNSNDNVVLSYEDVMKVDIGVHVNGHIIDAAFTMTFDERYDPLVEAVREATNTGVREAGIDVRLTDIGAAVEEVMESHEIVLDGKTYPIKCIRNLNGHSIGDFTIHAGKTVPIVSNGDETKMEEGETFAIETFGSTGRGYVVPQGECSHYALNAGMEDVTLPTANARQLAKRIRDTFGTLPWCRRYLERAGEEKYLLALNQLVRAGVVEDYPPLVDTSGSYTAQFEHTILLHPHMKEVVSKGLDY